MKLVPLYAALLAFLFVALSIRAIRVRKGLKIAVGDGGDLQMLRAMRVHSNFAEYVPFALFLLFLLENSGAPAAMVHALGSLLFLGRIAHAYGVSQVKEDFRFRVSGMVMTFISIVMPSVYLLYIYVAV